MHGFKRGSLDNEAEATLVRAGCGNRCGACQPGRRDLVVRRRSLRTGRGWRIVGRAIPSVFITVIASLATAEIALRMFELPGRSF